MNGWDDVSNPINAGNTLPQASPWDSVSLPFVQPAAPPEAQGRLIDGTPISDDSAQRSIPDRINRQLQLAGRFGMEGTMAIPSIPGAVANLTRAGADSALGVQPSSPPIPTPIGVAASGMDAIGMPKPEGGIERLEGDVLRGVSGGLTAPGRNAVVTTGAATGGLASGGARELGFGPGVQFGAGLAGGMLGGPIVSAGNAAYGAVQPLFDAGRQQIANKLISRYATDPQAAAAALQTAPEFVPGSQPIAGEASNDPGLLGLQKTLQQQPENFFGERISDQNTARTKLINQVAGDDTTVPRYQQMRSAATKPLYDAAAPQPVNAAAIQPVLDEIDKQVAVLGPGSDAGKTLINLKSDIQGALPEQKIVQTGVLDANGNPIANTITVPKPQSNLIQIYRETRDALAKDSMQPGAYGATVKGVIAPINQQLGSALENQSPEFAQAQDLFNRMSAPINQAANMQIVAKKLATTQHDFQGNNMLSPAASERLMNNGEMNTAQGVQPLPQALSPEQNNALNAVNQDLARSNMVNSPVVRPPGSNTFNSTASTGQLANALGARIGEHIPFIKGAYQAAKPDIVAKLANTMLSPQDAAKALLATNRPEGLTLAQRMIANALAGGQGGAIGYVSGQSQK